MAKFAVINGDKVTNIIVADTVEIAQEVTGQSCVEYTDFNEVSIGYTYNPDTQEFLSPEEMSNKDA